MRQVIKSISDRRIYRPLTLPNQLECLLISDRDAQKSAAALSVGVGSFLDPQQAQGLAHYLEHMLFMGTQKYPAENEYSEVKMFLFSFCQKMLDLQTHTPDYSKQTTSSKSLMEPLLTHSIDFLVSSSIHSC